MFYYYLLFYLKCHILINERPCPYDIKLLVHPVGSGCLFTCFASSQMCCYFVNEPMAQKEVSDIPGIGPNNHRRLKRAGFKYADKAFGQYLK